MSDVRTLMVMGALTGVLVGCMGEDAGRTGDYVTVTPTICGTGGSATLDDGTEVFGDLEGTTSTGSGLLDHDGADLYTLFPDSVTCQINGSANSTTVGTALMNGSGGYTFLLQIFDHGDDVAYDTVTVSASRSYRPSAWSDGAIDADSIVVPETLPVIDGEAGNQWAHLSFTRAGYGDEITCRYRGGAAGPHGGAGGEAYTLVRCTGEDDGTPAVEGGDEVDVDGGATLHVQSGCHSCDADTVVEVTIEVGDAVPVPDEYHLQISQAGAIVYDSGVRSTVSGDLFVESRD